MPQIKLKAPHSFEQGFQQIRAELAVPPAFPTPVLAEADQSTQRRELPGHERLDARHLPLVAIDPPGATDLDQAFTARRRPSSSTSSPGYELNYAIADVGAFVAPGGAIDHEARNRGTTLYSPDRRTPLHPPSISENAASLLPATEKPALLWTFLLDSNGEVVSCDLQRAWVRVAEAISYQEAQRRIQGSTDDEALHLLAEIGRLRQELEADRGGVSINLPAQEVVERDGSYHLEFDTILPVEGWNAQLSLLTGMVAGQTMIDAGVGIVRTLPRPVGSDIDRLRRTATALGLNWEPDRDYASFVRSLTPNTPASGAFLVQSTRVLRGAGYEGFNGPIPDYHHHSAIASVYAHVTAPLRRLVDRFANEILLALYRDETPPMWAVEALDSLPSQMGRARQRESALDRAMLDFTEAMVLEPRVGHRFTGLVVDLNQNRQRARIQIAEPAIVADIDAAGRTLAEELQVELTSVNIAKREVRFEPASPTTGD